MPGIFEYYLEDFAAPHEDDKVIDILRKTMKKMTPHALEEAGKINVSERMGRLMLNATEAKP